MHTYSKAMGVPCAGRSHSHARSMPVVGRLSTGTSMLACGQPTRPQDMWCSTSCRPAFWYMRWQMAVASEIGPSKTQVHAIVTLQANFSRSEFPRARYCQWFPFHEGVTYIYVCRAPRLKVGGITANPSTYNNYRESCARAS
jgi:hypothetical protein